MIKQTLMGRSLHRSYEMYLFGKPEAMQPHGMSCAGMYLAWRDSVLDALRNPDVPKYLMLQFMSSPEVLIEYYWMHLDRDVLLQKALLNFDRALAVLLDIIRDMPQSVAPGAVQESAPLPTPVAPPSYTLQADMEGRRLVIRAGAYTLVSKHRLDRKSVV